MNPFKLVILFALLIGLLTLFGIVIGTVLGIIAFDNGLLGFIGTGIADIVLLAIAYQQNEDDKSGKRSKAA